MDEVTPTTGESPAQIPQTSQAETAATAIAGEVSPWDHRTGTRMLPDPDLDATTSERNLPYEAQPEMFLRLVANPFLGVFALMVWFGLMYLIVRGVAGAFSTLALLLGLATLALLPRFLHYHCLDCGRTGLLTEWKRHVCPSVVARRFEGRARRWHGPTPTVQVLLWLWFLAAVLVAWQSGMLHAP